ncbi:hypothetical protein [Nocardia colli]|uniref:hypothetical protein n=1 Tax=Nocardia colli TaxID=2545717 RepID=UPI0035D8D320
MDTAEINEALAQVYSLPHGRLRVERLEMLAAAAKSESDRHLEGRVLLELAESYTYASERDLAPVAYGRLLRIYDENPAELGSLTHSVHWYLKWMTWGLIDNPAIPVPTVYRWFDELENRYRQRGYSLRPVLALRGELARKLGDAEEGARLHEEAQAAPRDGMSDCDACERNEWGTGRAALGDDVGALAHWQAVIDGDRTCAEEPHRVLGQALLPLMRTGRIADARGAHLTGYPLVRHNDSLRPSVALHIEFCALTGNEGRGLEILSEHARWLTDPGADAGARLAFLTGVCVLLRRLVTLGLGYVQVTGGTVDSLLAELDTEIAGLCARYDLRNGNSAVSTLVATRLARQPLLERLPLGLRSRLPEAKGGASTCGDESTAIDAATAGGVSPDAAAFAGDGFPTSGAGSEGSANAADASPTGGANAESSATSGGTASASGPVSPGREPSPASGGTPSSAGGPTSAGNARSTGGTAPAGGAAALAGETHTLTGDVAPASGAALPGGVSVDTDALIGDGFSTGGAGSEVSADAVSAPISPGGSGPTNGANSESGAEFGGAVSASGSVSPRRAASTDAPSGGDDALTGGTSFAGGVAPADATGSTGDAGPVGNARSTGVAAPAGGAAAVSDGGVVPTSDVGAGGVVADGGAAQTGGSAGVKAVAAAGAGSIPGGSGSDGGSTLGGATAPSGAATFSSTGRLGSGVQTGGGVAVAGFASHTGVGSSGGAVLTTGAARPAASFPEEWPDGVVSDDERLAEVQRLAEVGAARLADAPEQAEARLREALTVGAGILPAEHLARLSSQLVIAISGQPDRELDLADAAVRAAARWEGVSEPDLLHHTVIAARAFHRGRRHGEAAALFEEALAADGIPYPPTELATVRAQFGDSLNALHRYHDAARQFAQAAQLIEHDPDRRGLHAELALSAAIALEYCDQDAAAVAAYQRAAELFGALGNVVSRARCVRSAAWLQLWVPDVAPGRPWLSAMQSLITELIESGSPTAEVSEEIAQTRRELGEMLDAEDGYGLAGE